MSFRGPRARPLLAALTLAAAACAPPRAPAPEVLLLVSIDTLRADHLGCYGYARSTSPAIDAWAAGGTLFEDVTSPSPWTLPAHASMLTGYYPSRHGLKELDRQLPGGARTVAEMLAEAGWATAAVVNSQHLGPRFGLARGFAELVYLEERMDQREPTRRLVDLAIEHLHRPRDRPLFLFLHTYDVHSDYRSLPEHEAPFLRDYGGPVDGSTGQLIAFRKGELSLGPRDAARLVDLYDAGIRQADAEFARLLEGVERSGRAAETTVVLLSDHGEEFLDHGGVLHGRTHFQELLRVPLVIHGPGVPAGRRVGAPVSLVDVAPTLLALAGVAPPAGLDGIDLSPTWKRWGGAPTPRLLFAEADHNNAEPDILRTVRDGRHKLILDRLDRTSRLFDLEEDPGERTDMAGRDPRTAARLRAEIARFLQLRPVGEAGSAALSQEEIALLRSLGYLP
ncbi:MAG: sulfatase [Thermoanaerobaculia bacterium]|nr:sulfatase [Thermoanaerobaculia bacterium]